jgi:hypothetical protein
MNLEAEASPVTERQAGVAGVVAFAIFWVALFAFGAARSDYSHFTKAVSELGVIGAPHALAWNLIGFVVPGILLAICGAGLATAIDGRKGALWWLLVISGMGFAATGVPAEMYNGSPLMQSPLTLGHVLASFLAGIPWAIATFLLVIRAKHNPNWGHLRLVGAVLALLCTFGLLARGLPAFEYQPGLGQRVGFVAYFAWYLVMSIHLLYAAARVR